MGKVSGHGGYWVRSGDGDTVENAIVHNAEYEAETEAEIHETRSSGSGNWTEGLPVIKRIASLTMTVAEDETIYPQALGLTEGAELTLWLKRGALAEYDLVTATTVKSVTVINDQQKARRVRIMCQHGKYERDVDAPTVPDPEPTPDPDPEPIPP